MDAIAKKLLLKLLDDGNKQEAGARLRAPALTTSTLEPYRKLVTWHQKRACEDVFSAARSVGAIELIRDRANPEDGFIERINLKDTVALAHFLGETTLSAQVVSAKARLSGTEAEFPVITDIVDKWAAAGKVRLSGPADVQDWLDAMAVIRFARDRCTKQAVSIPIREASAALFQDSKRIEKLAAQVDVLLTGAIDTPPRDARDVWQEIGLFREEQPTLMAGNVKIVRERVTAVLDAPYTGLPANAIQGVSGTPDTVMTIENLTTFHSEAKRCCNQSILLIYTGGMPSPAWRDMYARILSGLPKSIPVYHWGDIDEGGFRIASVLAKVAENSGHQLQPCRMSPDEIPQSARVQAKDATVERMTKFAIQAGWIEIAQRIGEVRVTVEQESF